MSAFGVILTAFVMALGVAGTVLPVLPGLGLILAAALVHALVVGVGTAGWVVLGAMTVLAIAGTVAKYVQAGRRAAGSEPSGSTLVLGTIGGIVGFFAIPVIGFPIGGAVGVLVAQYRRSGDWSRAWQRTRSVLIGFGIGTLIEVVTGLVMVIVWLSWVILR